MALRTRNLKSILRSALLSASPCVAKDADIVDPSVPSSAKREVKSLLRNELVLLHRSSLALSSSASSLLCDTSLVDDAVSFERRVTLEPLSGGNSNEIFVVHVEPQEHPLLLRVYGSSMEHIVDRSADIQGMQIASDHGIGPTLLTCFSWGRLEDFLFSFKNASTSMWLSSHEPWHLQSVARALASIHSIPLSSAATNHAAQTLEHTPPMLKQITSRLLTRLGTIVGEDHVLMQELKTEQEWLLRECAASPLVFSHNDLNPGNILWRSYEPSEVSTTTTPIDVRLIDFEYSGVNHRCFDLGNTMCEMDYDYSVGEASTRVIASTHNDDEGPTRQLNISEIGFLKPQVHLHHGGSPQRNAEDVIRNEFFPHLPVRLLRAHRHECVDDPLAMHLLKNYMLEYHNNAGSSSTSATPPLNPLQELFVGMLASHLVWGVWGTVVGAGEAVIHPTREGGTVHFPRGQSGLDYASYGECRLLEYASLKTWMAENNLLSESQ